MASLYDRIIAKQSNPPPATNTKSSGGTSLYDRIIAKAPITPPAQKTPREIVAESQAKNKAQSDQIDAQLKKESSKSIFGKAWDFIKQDNPATAPFFQEGRQNIKQTAQGVAADIKADPAGSLTAIPIGLFDAGSAALNTVSNLGQKAMNVVAKPIVKAFTGAPTVGKPAQVPLFSQQLDKFARQEATLKYGFDPGNQETDTSKALRESATNVSGYEMGGGLVRGAGAGLEAMGIGGRTESALSQAKNLSPELSAMLSRSPNLVRAGRLLQEGVASRTLGNVVGGQLTADPETSFKDRTKQAAFDAAFGLATEGAGAVLGKAKGAFSKSGAEAIEPKASEISPDIKPTKAPANESSVVYKPKANLGTDASGEKVLAKTQFDNKTGRAIIYYDQTLDANPKLKQATIDHEYGHVLDKRVNAGSNISSELPNYKGNKATLDESLGEFATKQGKTPEQVSKAMVADINKLAKGSNQGEQFANAVMEYRKNPSAAEKKAPTFAAFMDHSGESPRITERVITAQTMPKVKETAPVREKPMAKPAEEAKFGQRGAKAKETTVSQETSSKPSAQGKGLATGKTKEKIVVKDSENGVFSSTGLKTGKNVKTKSFNPEKINTPDETKALFDSLEKKSRSNFASQRISKSNEDIQDLARMTGLTEDQLVKAKPGSIANSETVTAARQLVLDKAQDLMNYLKSTDVSVATPKELEGIRDRFVKLVAMQKSVAGLRTEASNVFRSLGIELMPGENATLAELGQKLKEAGLASKDDAALFSKKVAEEIKLTRGQKIGQAALSTWYSAILSGPKTTSRNIVSTSAKILTELASKAANPKQWKEIPTSVSGLLRGLAQGFDESGFKRALTFGKSGQVGALQGAEATTKFMETGKGVRPNVFDSENKLVRGYGNVIESVGRFLNAQDTLLKSGAREMERASLKVQGIKDEVLQDAMSRAYAESAVYHGAPKGRFIGAARDSMQTLRAKYPESKIIIPFVDTVANVLDSQFDYIPVFSALRLTNSTLDRQVARIAKDFNITSEADQAVLKMRLRDQQIGRMVLGTAVSGAAVTLAAQGKVSGMGPTNVDERKQLESTGWRPNSIKVGKIWIPYTNLGPLAGIFAMAGNVYDKTHYDKSPTKSFSSLLGKGMIGWTQTQLNSSFLSGVADLMDVLKGGADPKTYLTNLGAGLVPIPAAYSQIKDMAFRQQYETSSIQDKLKQKLGITSGLQPRLNAFGKPVESDLIYGLTPSKSNDDPVANYLIKNELVVTKPKPNQQYDIPGTYKERRALTPTEYTEYLKTTGSQIYDTINTLKDALETLPADRQKTEVQSIVDKIRTNERTRIMLK